jgi:hypothetical protein
VSGVSLHDDTCTTRAINGESGAPAGASALGLYCIDVRFRTTMERDAYLADLLAAETRHACPDCTCEPMEVE